MFQQLRNSPLRDFPYPWYGPPAPQPPVPGRSFLPIPYADLGYRLCRPDSEESSWRNEDRTPQTAYREPKRRCLEAERTSSEVQTRVRRVSAILCLLF